MMLHSLQIPLLTFTLTHILGSSLAAPSSPMKPTPFSRGSRMQLNGVPGPHYDGDGADSAQVAGVLATLVFPEEKGDTHDEIDSSDTSADPDLSLFVVINEYKDDQLIRQSSCFEDSESGMPVSETICTAIIGFPMVEGSLDITALQRILREYLTVQNTPRIKQAVERRKTMSLVMENAESGFSFAVRSDGVMSKKIALGKGEDLERIDMAENVYDFIWKPKDGSERGVKPYNWTEGQTLS